MMRKNIKARSNLRWKSCILYAFLIVLLGNVINYFFGMKAVTSSILKTIKFFELDVLFYNFLYFIEPYLHLEKLAFLKDWLWLIPFIILAFIFGAFHSYAFEKRLGFKEIFLTTVFVYIFKLFSYSVPYGITPVFLYFIDFFKKFCMEPILLVPVCFLGLFVGTEGVVVWVKNTGAESLLERYK